MRARARAHSDHHCWGLEGFVLAISCRIDMVVQDRVPFLTLQPDAAAMLVLVRQA